MTPTMADPAGLDTTQRRFKINSNMLDFCGLCFCVCALKTHTFVVAGVHNRKRKWKRFRKEKNHEKFVLTDLGIENEPMLDVFIHPHLASALLVFSDGCLWGRSSF